VRVTSPWKVPGRSHYEFMQGGFEEWWDALPGPERIVFPLELHHSVRLEITAGTRLEELQVATTPLRYREAELALALKLSSAGGLSPGTLKVTIRPENFPGTSIELPPRSLTFTGHFGEMQASWVREFKFRAGQHTFAACD